MINVAIVDDHNIVRQGIKHMLDAETDITVVFDSDDGYAALDLVSANPPDVLVVDLAMPRLGGLEVTRKVVQMGARTRVVVLSMHETEVYVLEALNAGAFGYILKDSSPEDLTKAVREVAQGRKYLSPRLSERAIQAYITKGKETQSDLYSSVSEREREVLFLAAEGLSNGDIGERLAISPRTVEVHRSNLMRKLGLKSQTELVRFAVQKGIIPMSR